MELRAQAIRKEEGAACPRCGRRGGVSQHGIPVGDVVSAIAADRGLVGAMGKGGTCADCGRPTDWDIVSVTNGVRREGVDGTRRSMLTLIGAQLLLGRRPDAIAAWIRRELGVVGILVAAATPVGRRFGLDGPS